VSVSVIIIIIIIIIITTCAQRTLDSDSSSIIVFHVLCRAFQPLSASFTPSYIVINPRSVWRCRSTLSFPSIIPKA